MSSVFSVLVIDAESKCMPLSYNSLAKEPKQQVCCDLPTSNNCIQDGDYVALLATTPFMHHVCQLVSVVVFAVNH